MTKKTNTPAQSKTSEKNILAYVQKLSKYKPSLGKKAKTGKKSQPTSGKKKWLKRIAIAFAAILVVLGLLALLTIPPLLAMVNTAKQTQVKATETIALAKSQDLIGTRDKIVDIKSDLSKVNNNFRRLGWYKLTPLRPYYIDGENIIRAAGNTLDAAELLITTVEPYADVLGLKGKGSFTGGTAEDRIVKIVETLGEVVPQLQEVSTKLTAASDQINQVNPDRYDLEINEFYLPELITKGQGNLELAATTLNDFLPLLEVAPELAGLEEEKKYLVLFQNDAEIRPTGGFMTAYGILKVEKGRVSQEKSDDIYGLDEKFNSRLQPPAVIKKYLPLVFYWHMRDMNLSPDFTSSMDTFYKYYQEIPGEPDDIDGIISIDTNLLSGLVGLLQPVEVPGFGNFTAEPDPRCDGCPQVIYELEDIATRPVGYVRDDRKAFLAPMMQTILLKAYGAPSQVWPTLFKTVIESVQQKHVLFYFFDETAQAAVEKAGFAGRIEDFDGDYLHINDANFGGAKSNLFITEEIEDKITVTDSGVEHALTVTYKNPAPASNCNLEAGQLCLNGTYRDFVRFYLPEGTELTDSVGFQEGSVETSQDLGKTVVEGFFTLQPKSQAKLKLNYTVPYQPEGDYQLLIQKQPGKKTPKYTIIFNNTDKAEFDLLSDKQVTFSQWSSAKPSKPTLWFFLGEII